MIKISSNFNPLKIFISSSWTDETIKEECRRIEEEYIPMIHLKPIIGDTGSDDPTRLLSVKKVRESDIVLIILGVKYSDLVLDEYEEAKAYDIPILVLIKDRLEMEDKLVDLFNKIKAEKSYKRFENMEDLKVIVIEKIIDLISERFRQYQEIYKVFLGLLDKYTFKIPKRLLDKLNKLNK
jgi:hypothetical protein